LEAEHIGYKQRYNIYTKLEKLLFQDWVHYDDIDDLNKIGSDVK